MITPRSRFRSPLFTRTSLPRLSPMQRRLLDMLTGRRSTSREYLALRLYAHNWTAGLEVPRTLPLMMERTRCIIEALVTRRVVVRCADDHVRITDLGRRTIAAATSPKEMTP